MATAAARSWARGKSLGDSRWSIWRTLYARGGPTIARPVTAARSEHPTVVLHSIGKKATLFDDRPYRVARFHCSCRAACDVRFGSEADVRPRICDARFTPRKRTFGRRLVQAGFIDIGRTYSITSSAATSSVWGTVMPSAFAALRLITSSNCVARCTGKSLGLSPCRMRLT